MNECPLYYGGKWHQPVAGNWYDVCDPGNSETIGRAALATAADIDLAVVAAKQAQSAWANSSPIERASILRKAATLIEQSVDAIATELTREQGKPLPDNRKEILFGVQVLRFYAEEACRIGGSIRPTSDLNIKNVVSYHPVGIVAAIVPWNYPVDLYCWKVGPALAAGCPIIVKPPHETPFAIASVVKCFDEAGVPAGVLGNLQGYGHEAGAALSAHNDIALISATASVPAGQEIMRSAAGNLKKIVLELGGQAPFIVLPDADLEVAAQAAMRRSFSNMGQICITVNRILVHRDVHRAFVEKLHALTAGIKLGYGMTPGIEYGPVLNQSVIDRTQRHVDDAIAKGGTLLTGGFVPGDADLQNGHFYRPTLIDNAPLDSLPMTEESFGPVAAIRSCDSIDEILTVANCLPYGLAAYLYSEDLALAWALADQLEFGAIGINVNDTSELQAPFGGWKLSGIGRELGREGLESYLESKHIKMRVNRLLKPAANAAVR